MTIQWYPGHMHKAQKQIKEALPKVDLLIEVLDARIPFSSENPAIKTLRQDKPCIKVLSKTDLADPLLTAQWQEFFEKEKNVKTLAITTEEPAKMKVLIELSRKMLPNINQDIRTIHTMIVGIPNVGKSTLINILAGKIIAKTGNEPAVTKSQQRINLGNGIMLMDTPGILWPKVENPKSSYRLAASGAIKDTAMEYDDVAFFVADYLLKHYPELLIQRFELKHLPATELEFLELAAARRGCFRAGGRINLHKISEILVNELRSGMLGRITLETPAMAIAEMQEVEDAKAAKAAAEKARKEAFKNRQRKQKTDEHGNDISSQQKTNRTKSPKPKKKKK